MDEETQYAKSKWVKHLGVSTSGYYELKHAREERTQALQKRTDEIKRIFESGQGHYGADRICGILRRDDKRHPMALSNG